MNDSPLAPARRGPVLGVIAAVLLIAVVVGVVVASTSGGDDDASQADADALVFGPVTFTGEPLTPYENLPDPAVGTASPTLTGVDPVGDPIEIAPGEPTAIFFLAHWCPHCQREVPVIVDLAAEGAFDGVRLVAVLTASDAAAPNYPPVAWLEEEGWPGEILLDDEDSLAAAVYGSGGFPFVTYVDADGTVIARTSGEQDAATIADLAASIR